MLEGWRVKPPHLLDQINPIMKIVRKNSSGESREVLLREYFITASLIALLKRVGEEAARVTKGTAVARQELALARVRH